MNDHKPKRPSVDRRRAGSRAPVPLPTEPMLRTPSGAPRNTQRLTSRPDASALQSRVIATELQLDEARARLLAFESERAAEAELMGQMLARVSQCEVQQRVAEARAVKAEEHQRETASLLERERATWSDRVMTLEHEVSLAERRIVDLRSVKTRHSFTPAPHDLSQALSEAEGERDRLADLVGSLRAELAVTAARLDEMKGKGDESARLLANAARALAEAESRENESARVRMQSFSTARHALSQTAAALRAVGTPKLVLPLPRKDGDPVEK